MGKRFGLLLTPIEYFNYLLLDKSHWKKAPIQQKVVYYHETEAHYVKEYELVDSLFRTGYEYFFLNQPDVRPIWRTIRLKYFNTCLLELSGNMLNGEKHFTNSLLPNVISIEEPNDKILYGYWVKNTLEYNLHLFFLDEENSEVMLTEKLLMENVLLFKDENEHQMFNGYVKTHWCNKDEYIDRDYKVNIPKVIGKDLRPFVVELYNIHILQNMFIEFREENESKATNIQL